MRSKRRGTAIRSALTACNVHDALPASAVACAAGGCVAEHASARRVMSR